MLRRAILRDAGHGVWLDFSNPEAVRAAYSAQEVVGLLDRVDAHCRQGGYAAGYLGYEAALAMDPAFACFESAPGVPLAVFGLFSAPLLSADPCLRGSEDEGEASLEAVWTLKEDYPEYVRKIERIRQAIGAGNLYQVNYTLSLEGQSVGAVDLFRRIGCSAPYGAYLDLGSVEVVSGSPELFFRLQGEVLESAPMKGTVARGETPAEDAERRRWLQRSDKNRAENLMIADMVRNDMGRIARTGSVQADAVFAVQALPTVWQMTSTVRARTDEDLAGIFRGLFPAASITGAPKVASMALIRELETAPRGIYTGAIGFVGPGEAEGKPGPGLSAQFNVAIRTAWINRSEGRAVYGAGGGIVWDSQPEEEYEEVAIKARGLTAPQLPAAGDFELLETIGWSPDSGFDHLPLHLARLTRAAAHYGFALDLERVRVQLASKVAELSRADNAEAGRWRVRLCVAPDGAVSVSSAAIELAEAVQPVMLAREAVRHDDPHLTFKTTRRGIYERAAASVPVGVEALLWNDLGHVTESSIANLVYVRDGQQFTPPLGDGLLPGVLREKLLSEGALEERSLPADELPAVSKLYLINGLRGWRQAEFLAR
jgi:para-aminobenzoate synthetase/4-amino-4-deoxychorismate lyase